MTNPEQAIFCAGGDVPLLDEVGMLVRLGTDTQNRLDTALSVYDEQTHLHGVKPLLFVIGGYPFMEDKPLHPGSYYMKQYAEQHISEAIAVDTSVDTIGDALYAIKALRIAYSNPLATDITAVSSRSHVGRFGQNITRILGPDYTGKLRIVGAPEPFSMSRTVHEFIGRRISNLVFDTADLQNGQTLGERCDRVEQQLVAKVPGYDTTKDISHLRLGWDSMLHMFRR